MNYILYIAQESNSQSRSMLIPMEAFLRVRYEDYNILKQHATRQVLTLDKPYIVDQVLFMHYK
jgi:hypothetical protein